MSAGVEGRLLSLAREYVPRSVRRALVRFTRWPPVGWARFGSLRRVRPISSEWGFDRGLPVDRYYIERFLRAHAGDIRGHGLEIKEDLYSTRFSDGRLTRLDILHPEAGNPRATLVADLTQGTNLPSNTFQCAIVTQTLHLIYDIPAAVATLHRVLAPGGVLLATVSGISKISRGDMDRWGHHWSMTTRSAAQVFEPVFGPENVVVEAHGNVLSAVAFLHGLASSELSRSELEFRDPDYQVLITIRATKRADASSGETARP